MTIAKTLKTHLESEGVPFESVPHPRTYTASHTAQSAHVPGDNLAKAVVIHHEEGYVLAVVPASHRIDLPALQEVIDRRMGLASESELDRLFPDCDQGAAPPVGAAYGVPTVLDTSLEGREEVWFEGGDHRTLIKVSGAGFDRLMQDARRARFSHHA